MKYPIPFSPKSFFFSLFPSYNFLGQIKMVIIKDLAPDL